MFFAGGRIYTQPLGRDAEIVVLSFESIWFKRLFNFG